MPAAFYRKERLERMLGILLLADLAWPALELSGRMTKPLSGIKSLVTYKVPDSSALFTANTMVENDFEIMLMHVVLLEVWGRK